MPGVAPFTNTDLTGGAVDMSTAFDRGREELFRRLVEMTTTRGNVFTVYALGQAITQTNPNDPTTKRIVGTHQIKVTFQLVPKKKTDSSGISNDFRPGINDDGTSADSTISASDTAIGARFLKPDHYDVKILSAISGNS